ncbi:MAG: hypothetical protein AAF732_24390 [Pseudomonadota bacterium]
MTARFATIFVIPCILAGTAFAQLVPEAVETSEVCPNRPSEPEIIADLDVRESHKRILVQRMYRAAAFQDIVDTGRCTCEVRFPSWDVAVDYYLENYSRIDDQYEVQQATKTYRSSIAANRAKVRELCQTQGNWD